jgi:predicted ribosomally synthesized peptide with SipW-like signal peptide
MMNKKILLSILVLGTVAVVAGAGTWAAFSDTETSTGNTFTAGTLDLILGSSIDAGSVPIDSVYPSASGTRKWTITNGGSLDGLLSIGSSTLALADHTPAGVDTPKDSTLDTAVTVQVILDEDQDGVLDAGELLYSGTLGGLQTALAAHSAISMPAHDVDDLIISWSVLPAADNGIQGDTATFDLTFTLNQ